MPLVYMTCQEIYEWCYDWARDYPEESVKNPTGASDGLYRILRGGSWSENSMKARSAQRHWDNSDMSEGHFSDGYGFRFVKNLF